MEAASVLFGCVGAAGSAQEEDEVCEDILQRNVVLITPFDSSGIPLPYIRLSTRLAITTEPGSCHCSTELPWSSLSYQSRCNYPYPFDLASKLHGPPHFHKRKL